MDHHVPQWGASTALHTQRLARAYVTLVGLSVGDALGGFFEGSHGALSRRVRERLVPGGVWRWTDDTHMACALFGVLRRHGFVDQDAFAGALAEGYDRSRGYGMSTRAMLARIRRGDSWHTAAAQLFDGSGSSGNGSASRVPPVGAFFADDLTLMAAEAGRSAAVTHAHPEAAAGAVAVAAATAWAWRLRAGSSVGRVGFLSHVLPLVPASEVRRRLLIARDLPPATPVATAAATLGNGASATAQETVPFALWCAGERLDSYEEAIWLALAGQGDCDTVCAIVGGIIVAQGGVGGIPPGWRAACEPV